MSRILRSLVCLLLICCILVNLSPLKAQASAAGAIGIIKASTVTVNPYVITAAMLIALGIYAGVDSGAFETVANNCVDALEAAGTWIKDGVIELFRTEDADGNASFYVDSGLMENVRSWAFDSSIVSSPYIVANNSDSNDAAVALSYPYTAYTVRKSDGAVYIGRSMSPFYLDGRKIRTDGLWAYWYSPSGSWTLMDAGQSCMWVGSSYSTTSALAGNYCSSSYALSLGHISSVPVDGTSARQWSEDYTDRGLKVYGGGSGNNNNDGKWFWKLMLPLTAADLLLMSQADEWSGETPQEFDDYTTVEELEIVSRPEVEFGQGLELAPVTSPAPDTGGDSGEDTDPTTGEDTDPTISPGTGTDPGTGTNPDTGTDTNPDTGTDPNPDSGTDSGDGSGNDGSSWKPPSDHSQFALADLSKFFPFCIPFDLFDFFKLLNADPVAPSFTWEIQDLSGQTYGLTVDLSQWDSVAQLFRRLQLFLFVCGLAAASRKYIKW